MKKLIIPAAIALAAITSCQNGSLDVPEEQGSFSIKARVEALADTKSSVTDKGVFSWLKGDGIAVYDGSVFRSYYAQADGATATFTGEVSTTLQKVAVSPAGLNPSYSETALNVTLPASYKWVENQTNAPMISEFDEISKGLTFKYLGGIVKIQLKNVPANATKFVFTTSKDITGEYAISVQEDSTKIIASKGNATENKVTFTFDAGSAVRDMDFYIPVPVGEYTFAMGVYQNDDTSILTKTSTKTHTVARKGLLIINPISIGSTTGGGESAKVTSIIPSSHKGTFYLPSTTGTVDLTVEANTNAVEVVYAYGGDKPANVNVLCAGDVKDLTITLPESHVELSGTSAGIVTISSINSSTSASTLVLANTVKVSDLTIAKGSATIGCEVAKVTVAASTTTGDVPVIEVTQTGKVTESFTNNNASAVVIAVNGVASDDKAAGDGQIKGASGDNTNIYTPGEYLVKYLGANGTAVLDKDLEGDIVIANGTVLTVNLNGHTITNVKGDTFIVEKGASLTIEGEGTVDNITNGKACIYNNGTVILNGGTYTRSAEAGTSTSSSGGNSYYNILNHGTMTIADGVTVSSTGSFSSLIANGYYKYTDSNPRTGYVEGANEANASLTINGGSFAGGINTIKNDDGATLVINGGTFANTTQACVQNNHIATINGGTFNPSGAVAVQSRHYNDTYNLGKTTITGGTFNGSLVTYNGGTFEISGGTFNGSLVAKDGTFKISNGTFYGSLEAYNGGTFEISGGTFYEQVVAYAGGTIKISDWSLYNQCKAEKGGTLQLGIY